jgi:Skp family chaperone for outer membrane proteins
LGVLASALVFDKKTRRAVKMKGIIMKIRMIVILGCFIGVIFLSAGYEYGRAEQVSDTSGLKIGVVNVRKVLRNCRRSARYKVEVLAEQGRQNAELEKLAKELDTQEAGLKALKPGSTDYLAQFKELVNKRYSLEAQQEFNKQQSALKYYRWTEDLYKEILQATKDLAKQKGLDLVFGNDEPEFPVTSTDELWMVISTHKVLYNAGCLDLTDEVIARLDAIDNENP